MSMAMTLMAIFMPSLAPVQSESTPLTVSRGMRLFAPPAVVLAWDSGRMILAIKSAAGALITDAVSRWPAEIPKET